MFQNTSCFQRKADLAETPTTRTVVAAFYCYCSSDTVGSANGEQPCGTDDVVRNNRSAETGSTTHRALLNQGRVSGGFFFSPGEDLSEKFRALLIHRRCKRNAIVFHYQASPARAVSFPAMVETNT